MGDPNQAEHKQISTALEVERIDTNLFRSKALWVPVRGRGVFGGQVISQALVSATNSVDPAYGLHGYGDPSVVTLLIRPVFKCYFLLSASPAIPILYHVKCLRDGRSYATRSVKAVQNNEVVFYMLCSFHKPEPWQPSYHWPMPNVPPPEECELEEHVYNRLAMQEGVTERMKTYYIDNATERAQSPIAVKQAGHVSRNGETTNMYWMQARSIPAYDAPFQKCILSYLSDLYLIGSAGRTLGLKRFSRGPDAFGMTSSLDHSIYFYDDNFDCGDWLLYVMAVSRIGSGRGVAHGRLYARNGTLVAIASQEGVVRADRKGPSIEGKAKL